MNASKIPTPTRRAIDHAQSPATTSQLEALESVGRALLMVLNYLPDSDQLRDTPRRFAKMWSEFVNYDPGQTETCFEHSKADQMVVVKGMRVWSMCEHHLLPFWCDVSVGYIADGKVLGLSKFARIAHEYAHRLQLQERLVEQIAEAIIKTTGTDNVAVYAEGEHLCMTMRGIKTPALMVSSSTHGVFRTSDATRAEFLSLVRG